MSRPVTYITASFRATDGSPARRIVLFRRPGLARRQHARPEGRLGALAGSRARGHGDRFEGPAGPRENRATTCGSTGAGSTWRRPRERPRRRPWPRPTPAATCSPRSGRLPEADDMEMPRPADDDTGRGRSSSISGRSARRPRRAISSSPTTTGFPSNISTGSSGPTGGVPAGRPAISWRPPKRIMPRSSNAAAPSTPTSWPT